jgi:hypothetical protein
MLVNPIPEEIEQTAGITSARGHVLKAQIGRRWSHGIPNQLVAGLRYHDQQRLSGPRRIGGKISHDIPKMLGVLVQEGLVDH